VHDLRIYLPSTQAFAAAKDSREHVVLAGVWVLDDGASPRDESFRMESLLLRQSCGQELELISEIAAGAGGAHVEALIARPERATAANSTFNGRPVQPNRRNLNFG